MRKYLLCSAATVALLHAGSANAGDVAPASMPVWASSQYNWNGFYAGVVAGAVWGQYDPRTSTGIDGYVHAPGAAAITAAGAQTIKPSGFVSGIEGGYNWRSGNWLLGVEADLQAVHLNGATNSGAIPYPGNPALAFTVTSYGNADWLLTARPRIGFIAPNNWLLFATGGLALTQLQTDFSFVDDNGAQESGKIDTLKAGFAVGGGVEAPLTDRLSIKADYLHVAFSNTAGMSTSNNLLPSFPGQVFTHSSDLRADLFRAGLNYRFGGPDPAPGVGTILPVKAPLLPAAPSFFQNWQLETGTRLWLSTGTYGGPDPLIDTPPPTLASRLVYSDLDALSGETFFRADHASGFFVKGYLGAGGINSGSLNDEDFFPAATAYSNTLSSASGNIGYATIDAGYNFLRTPGAKVGAFIGYNYYEEDINAYGCVQLAASTGSCPTAPGLPANLLTLTDDNHFNSLRVGLSSQLMLTDKLRLTGDAAYLPWVSFTGFDDHLLRQLLLPEASNSGDGVMLEAMLDYYITPNWSVGVGGRYWAWNMNTGTETFEFLAPPSSLVETARFNAERYGAFVQTSYHWGETTHAAATSAMPTKAPAMLASDPMNWTGWYVGGQLGGGVDIARWSDPFGSPSGGPGPGGPGPVRHGAPAPPPPPDVAGFGDTTHATGPLGGAQIGANWQTGRWVLGAELDASLAHIRGENTCFSGLGGINCQHVVNALGSVTGRVGYAFDRSLAYVKAGGAWTDTTYNLFGNTLAQTLGTGSTSETVWGWTAGIGLEYAITNHWTTFAEYDHIGLPPTTVPFPTVAVVSAANIVVTQSADLFKMGVNYKFDFGPWTAAAAKD